ncbi:MAG: hypothetical protein Ta2G_04750 [Termitinemataceae bacterium]|nr:MAG: hypothetical protein Ta2G_04750 [Termitinemataceae bacterium]
MTEIFFPSSLNEYFSILNKELNKNETCTKCSSGVTLLQHQHTKEFILPHNIISLDKIDDLYKIDRTERYLEVGAMVTLSQIIKLGKVVPEILKETIQSMASLQLQNLLNLGCSIYQKTDSSAITAAMVALDARYELRSANTSRWIKAEMLANEKLQLSKADELLCRVRFPLEQWDYTLGESLSGIDANGEQTENDFVIFLASLQKDILSSVRIVFAGEQVIRERNIEDKLVGKKLPLDIKEAESFIDVWKTFLEDSDQKYAFTYSRFLNFIELAIMHFVD